MLPTLSLSSPLTTQTEVRLMDDSESPMVRPNSPRPSPLRRRNSIATSVVVPIELTLHTAKPHQSSSFFNSRNGFGATATPPLDFELASLKGSQSYTSLKDLLPSPASVSSPTAVSAAVSSGYEISIRNRLVKQAAWAYLQPMSSSPDSASGSRHFLRRLWLRFSTITNLLTACLAFVTSTFDRILRAIRVKNIR